MKQLNEIEEELAGKYSKEHLEKINAKIDGIDCEEGGINSGNLWNLKKQIFPKKQGTSNCYVRPYIWKPYYF